MTGQPAHTVTLAGQDPLDALLDAPEGAVLAVITGVEGPSYRPVGAMMAFMADGRRAGTLSSGCIEGDLAVHAAAARKAGGPVALRYGRGSPFIDIQLPCGGGLDIWLLPAPDLAVLADLQARRAARIPAVLEIDGQGGGLRLAASGQTGPRGEHGFAVRFAPALRFVVFGKGPEAFTFAGLVQSAGYPNLLLSPDAETLAAGTARGCPTRHLTGATFPPDLGVDARSAVLLFFHDHDWEPPLLVGALDTPAFYIGAQGSQRARDARLLALEGMGVARERLARLHGPVGLIPSARDAGTLAVSVLAEVLAKDMAGQSTAGPAA